jgi:hypothetical protein
MAIACTFAPAAPNVETLVTVSFTGLALTTAYVVSIVGEDGTESAGNSITSDGSGNASTTFVPAVAGLYTVSTVLTSAVTSVAGTVTAGNMN